MYPASRGGGMIGRMVSGMAGGMEGGVVSRLPVVQML